MKPLAEMWNTDNHGVKHVEHYRDARLSNLSFADDNLIISCSLEHDQHDGRPHHCHNSTKTLPICHRQSVKTTCGNSEWEEHAVLSTRKSDLISRVTHQNSERSPSQIQPPHQMRVGNFHKPPTRDDDIIRYSPKDKFWLFDASVAPSLPRLNS